MFTPTFPHHSWAYFPMILPLCVLVSGVILLLAIVCDHSIQLSYPSSNTSVFVTSQSQDTPCVLHWDGFLKRFVWLKAGCSLRFTTLTNHSPNPHHSQLASIMSSTALFLSEYIIYQFISLFNICVFLLSCHRWELGWVLPGRGCLSEQMLRKHLLDGWVASFLFFVSFFPDKGHGKQNFQSL